MLRKALKDLAYRTSFRLGLYPSSASKNSRLILMYHGVTNKDHTADLGRHLPARQFEEQLIYFKKHFHLLSLEELLKEKHRGTKPSLSLTFDDGFENNLTAALPLLEKHKIPATFYVCTFALQKSDVLYADILDAVRAARKEKELEFCDERYIKKGRHRLVSKRDGSNIYEKLVELSPKQLRQAFTQLAERYDTRALMNTIDPDRYKLMNEEQLGQLSSSPYATIGSHCKEHLALSTCDERMLRDELEGSKTELERITGKKVDSLAFPYGDHNKYVAEQSKKAGYTTLLSAGLAEHEGVLPRMGIISAGSFAQNMIAVHRGFERFGF